MDITLKWVIDKGSIPESANEIQNRPGNHQLPCHVGETNECRCAGSDATRARHAASWVLPIGTCAFSRDAASPQWDDRRFTFPSLPLYSPQLCSSDICELALLWPSMLLAALLRQRWVMGGCSPSPHRSPPAHLSIYPGLELGWLAALHCHGCAGEAGAAGIATPKS